MWNSVLFWMYLCMIVVVVGGQLGPNVKEDNTKDWTADWAWKLGDWPPNNTLGDVTDIQFPNMTSEMFMAMQSRTLARESSCKIASEDEDLRVYICTLTLPGIDVKSDESCDAVSSPSEYGCNWEEDDVTLCHRWRDRYTQSITFCKSTGDPCADEDDRLMMCACSVYYSWSTSQYFTYCDCQGPMGQFYIDACAFSYFGLLNTPTDTRTCRTVCSRRSECKECNTNTPLSSPGVTTFCMCQSISDVYGYREICPCKEHNDTAACSEDYDPFVNNGPCKQQASSTTMRLPVISGDPRVEVSPDGRTSPDPDVTYSSVSTDILTDETTYYTTVIDHVTTSRVSHPTISDIVPGTTNTMLHTSDFPRTTQQQQETSFPDTTNIKDKQRPSRRSRWLTSQAKMGIVFGLIGLIILLILVLLVLSLCCRCRCRRRRRKHSTSEIAPRADDFASWRKGSRKVVAAPATKNNNRQAIEHSGPSSDALGDRDISASSPECSEPYYKDYFQVVDSDAGIINEESPYYFKIADKQNESADVNTTCELEKVIEPAKQDDNINTTQARETTDESPYYFKCQPKNETTPDSPCNENEKSETDVTEYQALNFKHSEKVVTDRPEMKGYSKQISNVSDESGSYLKLHGNNDYFCLLQPGKVQQCPTDLNNDYFPLQTSGHSDNNEATIKDTVAKEAGKGQDSIRDDCPLRDPDVRLTLCQLPERIINSEGKIDNPFYCQNYDETTNELGTSTIQPLESSGGDLAVTNDDLPEHDYHVLEKCT